MKRAKQEIISFKVDDSLLAAIQAMPNRSEFIRSAILAALGGVCPLCQGTGTLTPRQKEHWEVFARRHSVARCGDCQEMHLVCSAAEGSQE
ncbi:MAG: ribbon-helix-helix domain-containing protein [Pseudomonadota bacterium]